MLSPELSYRYAGSSTAKFNAGRLELALATSGGVTDTGPGLRPHFFNGFLTDPAPAALGMLACAGVARARYYTPASVVAQLNRDPVVTSNEDRLRFESFSGCCGVHARLDLLPAALDGAPAMSGTTNVDFNGPMQAALSRAALEGPVLLRVGADEVAVTTPEAAVVERKVPLPARWLKGFGEVQALARRMRPLGQVSGVAAQRFLRSIPKHARRPLWVSQEGRSLSLSVSPRRGSACLSGTERLRELAPLVPLVQALTVYGPDDEPGAGPSPSAWELDLGRARLTLTVSAEIYRGFSGEGALLDVLADDDVACDADLVGVLLGWDPRLDVGRLSAGSGLAPDRVVLALSHLAASGRVGYDLAEEAFFHRELPFDRSALEAMHPRLSDARSLVEDGNVSQVDGGAIVRSGEASHRVVFGHPADRCTCPWWGKHQGSRGPCKHVLAARMARPR